MLSQDVFKKIHQIKIRCRRYVDDVLAGSYHSAFKGKGMEFEDVREYQPGDEVRSIDWNVTARMQTPYIKNFKEERELTVTLLVDVSGSSFFGTIGGQKRGFITEISALIALSAIKNNDRVALLLFSEEVECYIPPGKGTKHVMRLIQTLTTFKPQKKKTSISTALNYLSKAQKKKGLVFVVSDFFAPCFKKELSLACKRHEFVGIQVLDPSEEKIPRLGLMVFKDLETGLSRLVDTSYKPFRKSIEQKNEKHIKEIKKQFESLGGGFVKVQSGPDYMNELHRFFKGRRQIV